MDIDRLSLQFIHQPEGRFCEKFPQCYHHLSISGHPHQVLIHHIIAISFWWLQWRHWHWQFVGNLLTRRIAGAFVPVRWRWNVRVFETWFVRFKQTRFAQRYMTTQIHWTHDGHRMKSNRYTVYLGIFRLSKEKNKHGTLNFEWCWLGSDDNNSIDHLQVMPHSTEAKHCGTKSRLITVANYFSHVKPGYGAMCWNWRVQIFGTNEEFIQHVSFQARIQYFNYQCVGQWKGSILQSIWNGPPISGTWSRVFLFLPECPGPKCWEGAMMYSNGNIWVFPKIGVPQNRWCIMENPSKMDDLEVPLFLETPIYHWCASICILQKSETSKRT